MVIRRIVDSIDYRRIDFDGLYVFDAYLSFGVGFFRRRYCRYLRVNFFRYVRLFGSGRAFNVVVYRCWFLFNFVDDVNRRVVVF